MFCFYCGKEVDDGTVFCPFCGKNLQLDENEEIKTESESSRPQQKQNENEKIAVNEQYEKEKNWKERRQEAKKKEPKPAKAEKKNNKKTIVIAAVCVLVAAGLGIGAFFVFGNRGGDEVDLQALMYEPIVYGYEGFGEVNPEIYIDEEKMDEYLSTIKDEERRSAVKGFLLTVSYYADTDGRLANDDIITVVAEYDRDMARDIELKVLNSTFEYTVTGLEEGEDVAYNPEECDAWPEDFVFPDSDDRNLSDSELEMQFGTSSDITQRAINEIYARHGMIFEDSKYKNMYKDCAWYTPVYKQKEIKSSWLNKYENANLKKLTNYRKTLREMEEYDKRDNGFDDEYEDEDANIYCFNCNKLITIDEAIEANDTFYCEDCYYNYIAD